jgi:hypothetical protein
VRDRPALVVLTGAISAAGVIAALRWSAGPDFWVAVALYAAAHVVLFPSPSGRGVALVPGVAAAMALRADGSLLLVLAPAAVALPIGMIVTRLRYGRRTFEHTFPAEPVGLLAFGGVFVGAVSLFGIDAERDGLGLVVLLVAGIAWLAVSALAQAIWTPRAGLPRRLLLMQALLDWPAYAALMASAALFEVTDEAVGPVWALVLAGLPYAFSHLSLHRVQTTRRTYRQTIEAFGRVPEAGGLVASGRAERMSDLTVATAAEAGITGKGLERLEFAALLHDIGRIVLANPAVAAGEYSARDVAGWTAAIISEARYLEPVAQVIASEHEPYRQFGQVRDPGVPMESQIVRAVAAYVEAVEGGLKPLDAVEVLHLGAAYDHDPDVVAALRRVLERRGAIAA